MPVTYRHLLVALLAVHCSASTANAALSSDAVDTVATSDSQQESSSTLTDSAAAGLRVDTDSGIVANQAVTVAGQDFYQYFSSAWREKEGSEKYTISVHERPSARWGSEVWIEYAQRRVFRTILPPARAAIKPIAERSADAAFQAVLQADTQRQLANDADLGRDEI